MEANLKWWKSQKEDINLKRAESWNEDLSKTMPFFMSVSLKELKHISSVVNVQTKIL